MPFINKYKLYYKYILEKQTEQEGLNNGRFLKVYLFYIDGS